MYDGSAISVGGMDTHNICHEIAHWLIASPEQRLCPDFGLGAGPDSNFTVYRDLPAERRKIISDIGKKADPKNQQEATASIVGIGIEIAMGHHDWMRTLEDHNWIDTGYKTYTDDRPKFKVRGRLWALICDKDSMESLRLAYQYVRKADGMLRTLPHVDTPLAWRSFWRKLRQQEKRPGAV